MRWEDLEVGDKVKISKEAMDYYYNIANGRDFYYANLNKIYVIEHISIRELRINILLNHISPYTDHYINFDGTPNGNYFFQGGPLFEIVELGDL